MQYGLRAALPEAVVTCGEDLPDAYLPYSFGLFLGDPSYYVYTPKHFGSRVDILIGLQFFFLAF